MPTSDGPSHFPVFVAPLHAGHQRPAGYVPGRVAPVRLPPPAQAPPPLPVKPHGPAPLQRATFSLSEESRSRERARDLQQRRNTFICVGASTGAFFITLLLVLSLRSGDVFDENCPDHNPSLSSWNPGHQPQRAAVVQRGQVVFADSADGSKNITLRTHHILIQDGAALHIGAPKCRYRSSAPSP
ncbi:cell surface hyaluronidase-like [Takifugu rubripes]|uniref:cell surface hyaluronidase-like n=1 Tax=Takifugu rubripes TaxID=31033 RepID=UPI0011456872|nr:cell surface hyaluronidase-like [Takifugu rubripes]